MTEEARGRGRPSDYKPEYCEQVVDHMSEGASITSFAAEIDVARSTINEWMSVHPEFSEAVKRAKAKCAAWWEMRGRKLAEGKEEGNPTLVIFGLKNMADDDWRDKQEVQQKVGLEDGLAKLFTEIAANGRRIHD